MNKKVIIINDILFGAAGKTSLACAIKLSLDGKADVISLDELVKTSAKEIGIDDNQLGDFYKENQEFVYKILSNKLPKIIESGEEELQIVEGVYREASSVVFGMGLPKIIITIGPSKQRNDAKTLAINHEILDNYTFYLQGIEVEGKRTTEKVEEKIKEKKENVIKVIEELKSKSDILTAFLYDKIESIKDIVSKITYQTFDVLNGKGSSNSAEKFQNIEHIINGTKEQPAFKDQRPKLLDACCNTGYFSFRSVAANPKIECTAVDLDDKVIDIAEKLNRHAFHFPGIKFINQDIFDLQEGGFDIICHFSAFHHFNEKQQELLKFFYDKLDTNGMLLAEFEVTNLSNDIDYVRKYKRPADKEPCSFPNRITLQKWLTEAGFVIRTINGSPMQPDDENARFFYALAKG